MSILIKGAKMPSCCFDCIFRDKTWDECKCPPTRYYGILSCLADDKRASFCPLVELPEKHGKLIDADALIAKYGDWYTEEGSEEGFIGTLEMLLKDAPTVVEAEGKCE